MTTQCMKTTFLLIVAFLVIVFPLPAGLVLFSETPGDLSLAADLGQGTIATSQPVQENTSVGPCFGMFCALENVPTGG